jgi:hypothetical protein
MVGEGSSLLPRQKSFMIMKTTGRAPEQSPVCPDSVEWGGRHRFPERVYNTPSIGKLG